jgi:hypothetical protein
MRWIPLLALAAACASHPTPKPHDLPRNVSTTHQEPDTPPNCSMGADWNQTEIGAAVFGGDASELKAARVLIWQTIEDDRPLRLDEAIVWTENGGAWTLAHIYRHPLEEDRKWQVSMVFDAENYSPSRAYGKPPTHAELDKFLQDTWWKFDGRAEDGFKILGSGVCADAYQAAFGEPPWHHYGPK